MSFTPHQNEPSAADWSAVTAPKALESLRQLEKKYPKGKLVLFGDEHAWEFSDRGVTAYAASDAAGMIQLHYRMS